MQNLSYSTERSGVAAGLTKKERLSLLIAGAVCLILLVAYIVSLSVTASSSPSVSSPKVLEPMEGEEVLYNRLVAYKPIAASAMQAITVRQAKKTTESGKNESFELFLPQANEHFSADGYLLAYNDGDGNTTMYYPPVADVDGDFNYNSLYTYDSEFNCYYYVFLCSAVGTPYFDERVVLDTDAEKRNKQLEIYGFSDFLLDGAVDFSDPGHPKLAKDAEGDDDYSKLLNVTIVFVTYLDANGNEQTYQLLVGNKLVTEDGYYFMVCVDGEIRPNIYASDNLYFDYIFYPYSGYVLPRLTIESVANDGPYEPSYTTSFEQIAVKLHTKEDGASDPDDNEKRASVVVDASLMTPKTDGSGEYTTIDKKTVFTLSDYIGAGSGIHYESFLSALRNKQFGDLSATYATVASDWSSEKSVDLVFRDSVTYRYTVSQIESVIRDGREITDLGETVEGGDALRITYSYAVDGKETEGVYHAFVRLSELPEDVRNSFIGQRTGKVGFSFEIEYTVSNAKKAEVLQKIEKVVRITDKNGDPATSVESDSIVYYLYRDVLNGKPSDKLQTGVLLSSDASYYSAALRAFFAEEAKNLGNYSADGVLTIGKTVRVLITVERIAKLYSADGIETDRVTDDSIIVFNYHLSVNGKPVTATVTTNLSATDKTTFAAALRRGIAAYMEDHNDIIGTLNWEYDFSTAYYQLLSDFFTYRIGEVHAYTVENQIVAFRFQNPSERKDYYFESIYENALDPSNPYSLYGINWTTAENVLKVLGGIGEDSSKSGGMIGSETVAIGLTANKMLEKGLFAYRIYYEIPRYIYEYQSLIGSDLSGIPLPEFVEKYLGMVAAAAIRTNFATILEKPLGQLPDYLESIGVSRFRQLAEAVAAFTEAKDFDVDEHFSELGSQKGTLAGLLGLTGEYEAAKVYELLGQYAPVDLFPNLASDKMLDNFWMTTVGFNLYISELQDGGFYYVGSDMYDLVVKVDAADLSFLGYSFPELWARNNMILVSAEKVTDLDVAVNMEDFAGEYEFDLEYRTLYIYQDPETGKIKGSYTKKDGARIHSELNVYGSVLSESEASKLKSLYDVAHSGVSLAYLYTDVNGKPLTEQYDTVGANSFAYFYRNLLSTTYKGLLTDEEKAQVGDTPDMRISLGLSEDPDLRYVYEFYRVSERHVAVRLYQVDTVTNTKSPSVDDFYITVYGLKRIVNTVKQLVNGEKVDIGAGYLD